MSETFESVRTSGDADSVSVLSDQVTEVATDVASEIVTPVTPRETLQRSSSADQLTAGFSTSLDWGSPLEVSGLGIIRDTLIEEEAVNTRVSCVFSSDSVHFTR